VYSLLEADYLGAETRKLSLLPPSKNTGQTHEAAGADGAANCDSESSLILKLLQSGGRDSNPRPRAWEASTGLLNVTTGSWRYPPPFVETSGWGSQTLPVRSE
jgi:hypothetical protein